MRGAAQLLERELERPGAARVHAGDHQGGRPPAVAGGPPAHAAPRCRTSSRSTSTRCSSACAACVQRRVPGDRDRARLRHRACPSSTGDRGAADPGGAQHRAQRRAGDRAADGRDRVCARASRARSRIARQRYRLALAIAGRGQRPGRAGGASRDRIFYPLVTGREGGTGLGLSLAQTFVSQHERPRSNSRARRAHSVHDPAAARERNCDETGLDRRRRPLDPLGAREGARARRHRAPAPSRRRRRRSTRSPASAPQVLVSDIRMPGDSGPRAAAAGARSAIRSCRSSS